MWSHFFAVFLLHVSYVCNACKWERRERERKQRVLSDRQFSRPKKSRICREKPPELLCFVQSQNVCIKSRELFGESIVCSAQTPEVNDMYCALQYLYCVLFAGSHITPWKRSRKRKRQKCRASAKDSVWSEVLTTQQSHICREQPPELLRKADAIYTARCKLVGTGAQELVPGAWWWTITHSQSLLSGASPFSLPCTECCKVFNLTLTKVLF